MPGSDVEVVIVGGGAAGIAAARRLRDAAVDCVVVEARDRLGGRAWTVTDAGFALDLGCGWLHSADRNPWVEIAAEQGASIDKSPPPWMRSGPAIGFPPERRKEFNAALEQFFARLEQLAQGTSDAPASAAFEPGNRWNGLIDALSTPPGNGASHDHDGPYPHSSAFASSAAME